MSTDKTEATRLADVLDDSLCPMCHHAASMLRRWPDGEPVAWCALTASGKIAHFDGKPMVMPGPVGNEHHTHALYTAPPASDERIAALEAENAALLSANRDNKVRFDALMADYQSQKSALRAALQIIGHPDDAITQELQKVLGGWSMKFSDLPALNAPLDGGTFAGITTRPDGSHCAVVLLPSRAERVAWDEAVAWAKKAGGELPTRPVAALIFANVKDRPQEGWHWTSEALDASYACSCDFGYGYQSSLHKRYEGSAVAVRMIPLGGGA